jgi:hypothetical protein
MTYGFGVMRATTTSYVVLSIIIRTYKLIRFSSFNISLPPIFEQCRLPSLGWSD